MSIKNIKAHGIKIVNHQITIVAIEKKQKK